MDNEGRCGVVMSGSEGDIDNANENGRQHDVDRADHAGPRQTGAGAAPSPVHIRQESVAAVVVFPRKRPMHGTEPGQEEGVIELSLESLRCGERHAHAACVTTTLALPVCRWCQ